MKEKFVQVDLPGIFHYVEGSKKIIAALLVTMVVLVISGCVQLRPLPGYAKAGDTIIIGLGGIQRNAMSNYKLKPSDLTIVFTDAMDVQYSLTATNVFQVYPDHNSLMTTQILYNRGDIVNGSYYDGGWFMSVPLVDSGNIALTLNPGPGSLSVTSSKLINTMADLNYEADLTAIPLEILPGSVAFDADYNNQFHAYRPASNNHYVIKPVDLLSNEIVGGAVVVVSYTGATVPSSREPMILPAGHNPYNQLMTNWNDNGDGSGVITAYLLNPAGFTTLELQERKSGLLSDLELHLHSLGDSSVVYSLDQANSYYIDLEGNKLSGVVAEMKTQAEI